MTIRDFVQKALDAIGGNDRIRAIRSYRAEMRCEWTARGTVSTTLVWRAPGGRVRLEEFSRRGRSVRVVNADTGARFEEDGASGSVSQSMLEPAEVAHIRREAKIAPRNLLAHALDYDLEFKGAINTPTGMRYALSFPAERVSYFFDAESFLCTRLFDIGERSLSYDDYRMVLGVATPFAEREILSGGETCIRTYTSVTYDVDFPEDLFDVK